MAIDVDAAAQKPKKVQFDDTVIEYHSLKELQEAQQFVEDQAAAAATNKKKGIGLSKFRNQGPV